jgi:hypothetical protein
MAAQKVDATTAEHSSAPETLRPTRLVPVLLNLVAT